MFYSINTGCNLPVNNPLNYTKGNTKMTQNQFAALCGAYLIDPTIALENDNVIAAIRAGDVAALTAVLQNEF
jgi:hypothetical protein